MLTHFYAGFLTFPDAILKIVMQYTESVEYDTHTNAYIAAFFCVR